jgi:hypothetical protein
MRGKIDSLIFTPDSAKATKVEETVAANRDSFPTPQSDAQGINQDIANREIEAEVEVENVERPVDLYKVLLICSIIIIFYFLNILRNPKHYVPVPLFFPVSIEASLSAFSLP